MINRESILETINMVEKNKFDIRTITMGISAFDCACQDGKVSRQKLYDKITQKAQHLVKVVADVESEYGIPVINKRVSITPVSMVAAACGEGNYTEYARVMDRAAKEVGVDFIGGFSALVQKGFTRSDEILISSIPEALSVTGKVCASVNVASTRSGLNMDAIAMMGEVIKNTAYLTREADSVGCAKLVVFANAVDDNPFMAGAFLGAGEYETSVSVGVSGPGVVKAALESVKGESFDVVSETIKKTAFKITRAGEVIAREAARRLGVPFNIMDLSLAPTPEIGDSVARIIEEMGIESCGAHGTTAALALLNDAVKKGGIMASSHVGGLSGAFLPVSEDEGMIAAVQNGSISIDKLEAMTCVCSVGLDMLAVPGSTSAGTISAIIADECAIGVFNHKSTAVRIIPVYGKKVGQEAYFGGLLGMAPIMSVSRFSSEVFIKRGGRIPAPVHSYRN